MSDTPISDGIAFEDEPPPPPQAKPPHRWNRTMIGLAVGIVVLCAGILTPVYQDAREKIRRAQCLSNLKQLGLSMRLYSGDFGERFPTDSAETTLGSLVLMTNNYCTAMLTFMCPTDTSGWFGYGRRGWRKVPNPFRNRTLSYAYNGFGLTESVPPDTPLMADRTSGDVRSITPWATNRWTHTTEGGNVLLADGHVEWMTTLKVPMYNGKNP